MNGCVYRTENNKCEFYSNYGKGIVSYCDFDDCEEKKLSNADRIRAMTDEELANWLEQFASCELCPAIRERCGYGDGCVKAWLDWLKQEAID